MQRPGGSPFLIKVDESADDRQAIRRIIKIDE
jgi:hypothetical protein